MVCGKFTYEMIQFAQDFMAVGIDEHHQFRSKSFRQVPILPSRSNLHLKGQFVQEARAVPFGFHSYILTY